MLNLDAQVRSHGLTLYRDYNDLRLWWYVRDSPRLAREGVDPLFQLLIYRRDITDNPVFDAGGVRGGAFLIMTVDLDVDQGTLASVGAELSALAGGQVRLTPVPFVSGTASVKALGVGPGAAVASGEGEPPADGFVERVIAETTPSLTGANRAVFTVELSTEGAQLLRASLEEDGASAISVAYDVEFVGLRPARECSIVIDNRISYEHYRSRAQVNTLWFKADMDTETERLLKSNAIRIEDVNYLELDQTQLAARETELRNLAKELAQWTFFTPTIRPGDVLAKERGTLSVYDPTTDAEQHTSGFTTPFGTAQGSRAGGGDGPVVNRATTSRTGGVRAMGDVAGASSPGGDGAVTETDGTRDPVGEAGGEQGGGDASDGPRTAVERWNAAGRPQAAFTLRSLTQIEEQRIEYDLKQVSAHHVPTAPQGSIRLLAGDADLTGRIREVDLNDPFFERIAGTVGTTADLDAAGVSSMVVQLRYGIRGDGSSPKDVAEFVLDATDRRHEYAFFLDSALSQELEYRVTLHHVTDHAFGASEPSTTTEWLRTSTRNIDIDPRTLGGAQPISIVPGQVDWEAVQQVQASVTYRDAANDIDDRRTVVLQPGSEGVVLPVRAAPGTKLAPFTVTVTYFYAEAQESTEQLVERGQEVVLNQPPTRAVPVAVSVQDPLQRIARVAVELAYQPEGGLEQTRMLTLTSGQSESWSFFRPAPSAPARYRYRATTFTTEGTTRQDDWVETTSRQLVLGDVFPAILEVTVEIVGDLAAGGIQLARLVLEYPGAPPGVDARHEQALRPGPPESITWSVPSATAPPSAYQWEMTWVRGPSDLVEESGTADDELLLLFVPESGT